MLIRTLTAVLGSSLLLCASSALQAQEETPPKRFEVRQSSVSRSQAIGLSLAFPGLGQLATGHKNKGTALIVAELASVVIWLTSHEDFNTQETQFEIEKTRYLELRQGGTFAQAEESWKRLSDKKDDLDRSHQLRRAFGVLSLVVYSYNVLDVLVYDGAKPVAGKSVGLAPLATADATGLALVARF
jgi:hypothetical protein